MCFFFNDTATTEIYTLSLHDALPISFLEHAGPSIPCQSSLQYRRRNYSDRKSTRLNSSHMSISYAVFCLKKYKFIHTLHEIVVAREFDLATLYIMFFLI